MYDQILDYGRFSFIMIKLYRDFCKLLQTEQSNFLDVGTKIFGKKERTTEKKQQINSRRLSFTDKSELLTFFSHVDMNALSVLPSSFLFSLLPQPKTFFRSLSTRVARVHLGAITKARGSKLREGKTRRGRRRRGRRREEVAQSDVGEGGREVEFSDPLSLFTLSESRAP